MMGVFPTPLNSDSGSSTSFQRLRSIKNYRSKIKLCSCIGHGVMMGHMEAYTTKRVSHMGSTSPLYTSVEKTSLIAISYTSIHASIPEFYGITLKT